MVRDDATGVWSLTGDASWDGWYYLYEVEVYAPTTGQVETNLVTDPYSLSLATNSARTQIVDLSDAAICSRPAGRQRRSRIWRSRRTSSIYELHVRDFSVDDPTVPPRLSRHLQGVHRRLGRHGPSRGAGRRRADPSPPAAGVRHRHDQREQGRVGGARPGRAGDVSARTPRTQQAAVTATADLDGFNWGYDPWHYTTPEGSYSTDPSGCDTRRRVPRDGAGAQRARAAGRDGRGVQPHQRRRAGRQVGARSHRARLLPPAQRRRCGRDVDVLCQHGHRARHDGEADDRLDRHVGPRLQGRRVPLRPDGSPLARPTCSTSGRRSMR